MSLSYFMVSGCHIEWWYLLEEDGHCRHLEHVCRPDRDHDHDHFQILILPSLSLELSSKFECLLLSSPLGYLCFGFGV